MGRLKTNIGVVRDRHEAGESLSAQWRQFGQEILEASREIQRDPRRSQLWAKNIVSFLVANLMLSGVVSLNRTDKPTRQLQAATIACAPNNCLPPTTEIALQAGDKRVKIKTPRPASKPVPPIPPARPAVPTPPPLPQLGPLTYAQYVQNAQHYIDQVPNLARLSAIFPAKAAEFQRQKACIDQVTSQSHVTPADYANFKVDTTYQTVFRGHPFYNTPIVPRLVILHTSGTPDPTKSVAEIADGMMKATRKLPNGQLVSDRRSVQFMVTPDGVAHQTMEGLGRMGAQAVGANPFSIGIENIAYDACQVTAAQVNTDTMLLEHVGQEVHLPPSPTNDIGHQGEDFLFDNFSYNPNTGSTASIGKPDMPRDLSDFIIARAMELDRELHPA